MSKPGKITAMVSSTALDLPEHRKQVIDACLRADMFPIGMEHLPARDASGIRASLEMVDKADIYIGIYAWRYGWVPDFDNPENISITEMEFNHALERKQRGELKEILIFVMHGDHPIKASDKEDGDEAQERLKKFKERASAGRVRLVFKSHEELHGQVIHSLAECKRNLEPAPLQPHGNPIPKPPAFYAEPDYIGSHRFTGRQSQLDELDDWAMPADPHALLLYEAIGGNGKSMLTWQWATEHATKIRPEWAGRFWYSFYENGATVAEFCRHALAYMTGRALEEWRNKKTPEMKEELLHHLHAKRWLLILDGLERVLVAYHRLDAAEVSDEEADHPTDKIASRDPCSAIRDEDDDLLRALAAAAPSKVLASSRLTPRVLLNPSGQAINGVKRIALPGLRPADAEALLRSCDIKGESQAIKSYLASNCDCHPLVIGVLAGLINDYLPEPGNFDAWATDPQGGGRLDLGHLDLVQRRNHILRAAIAAIAALPHNSGQLLSMLALLPEAVDYPTLNALNPLKQHELAPAVLDLKRRGLLQYDERSRRYDLHPVVRGVAATGLPAEEKARHGLRAVDYFQSLPHDPYDQAETLEEVRTGLNVVKTLLKIGHLQQAVDIYCGDLARALLFNLEARTEALSLLRPFFAAGWEKLPDGVNISDGTYLANDAALALSFCGERKAALAAYGAALGGNLEAAYWSGVNANLLNISSILTDQHLVAKSVRVCAYSLDIATEIGDEEFIFRSRLEVFFTQAMTGSWVKAEATWQLLDAMSRDWQRALYRPGSAEWYYALFQFYRGTLTEQHLALAERLAEAGNNRGSIRYLHWLRGAWYLERGEWKQATASLQEALRMARERGLSDTEAETGLTLAKFHLGQLDDPLREAGQLAQMRKPAHRLLAELYLAIGKHEPAKKHALAAYRWAWADGEPYVYRHELDKTTELLQQLGIPIPDLPPYDPAKDEKFPWEDAVAAAIKNLRAEKTR